jgi:hypothetical protein
MVTIRLAGAVLSVAVLLASTKDARADEPAPAPPKPHGSVFVDPLGFALFGPRLGVEAGAGHFSGALYGRWFSPGLLAHTLFLKQGDSFGFSYGAGLRGRYYFADLRAGAHLGLAAELLHTRVENRANYVLTNQTYLVPYVEGGYRLAFGNFYGDLAAGFGYAARLSGGSENLPGGDARRTFSTSDESSVYGTASLDFGMFF